MKGHTASIDAHAMRTIPVPAPFLALLMACTGARPAMQAPDPQAELARMSACAAAWQNASAEAYWLYAQGYAYAALKLESKLAAIAEERRAGTARDERPLAVVVDIDETVLDNSPYQITAIQRGRTFSPGEWAEWTARAEAAPCPGALAFLGKAHEAGVEVFYITNRTAGEKDATLRNLAGLGFPDADEAHLLLMEGSSDKDTRRNRVRSTHRVLLYVGDQLRDLSERFKDRTVNYGKQVVEAMADSLEEYFILLPNPMYGTWLDAILGKGTDAEKLARMRLWIEQGAY